MKGTGTASHCPCPREESLGAKSNSFGHKTVSVQTLAGSFDNSILSDTSFLLLSWEGQNNALGLSVSRGSACAYVMEAVTQCQVLEISRTVGGEALLTSPVLRPPHPGKASQGEPQRKEDSHEMGLTVAFGVT